MNGRNFRGRYFAISSTLSLYMAQAPETYYRISSSDAPPLRIGLLLDSRAQLPAYAIKVVEDIKASNFARIKLLIVRKGPASPPPGEAHSALYRLYLRADARMKPKDDPFASVDCGKLLSEIESIEVEAAVEKGNQHLPAQVVEKLRTAGLDVLVRCGFDGPTGDLLHSARYGVWSLESGDPEFCKARPPQFWELVEHSNLSGMTLQVVRNGSEDRLVLAKSLFATEKTLSVSRNRFIPYWGSTNLIIRKLNELHRFGWNCSQEKAISLSPYAGKREPYKIPNNVEMLRWLAPALLSKAVSYPFRQPKVPHWQIAIRASSQLLYQWETESDLAGFRWIEAPQGHCWADPFGFEHEEKLWVFFENYSYDKKRAGIACTEISARGEVSRAIACLDHPRFHYSYPHILRAGSEIFMIPESFDSGCIDLYRCKVFPNEWIHEKRLLEGKFVDTTVWEHDGLWWLATTSAAPVPGAGSLLLFYSDSLRGRWQFHPENPISTDIRTNRGAGRVFRGGQHLIRPSQSGAPVYGYSITFNEITELSRQHYSERVLKAVTPKHWKGLAGVHTYNSTGSFEFIDGRTLLPLKRVTSVKL